MPVEVESDNREALIAFMQRANWEHFAPDAVCPFCGEEMDSPEGETHGNLFYDQYTCDSCQCEVTYIAPKALEYHESVTMGKIRMVFNLSRCVIEEAE